MSTDHEPLCAAYEASFKEWWAKTRGKHSQGRFIAKKAWNAAIEHAAECVVPGGDRESILSLRTNEYT